MKETENRNFIENIIYEDLGENIERVHTRFPPEPNGYLHIGHAKSILLNYGIAQKYNGKFNLRFDDTNPAKEETKYVNAIIDDIKWLGCDWEDRLFFASDYFQEIYNCAVKLIEKGLAYVCDLNAEEIREYRGTLSSPGKDSPYRNRTIEENLVLFEKMRKGEFADGSKTLRAKIDMASPNINMRDPIMYRIASVHHHKTGDEWCIYPMYDFAHPLEDAIEKITHSICTLEFEDHRPIYNWYINNLEFEVKPRQIEFAKLSLANSIMGKRYLKALVDNNEVDGWDDPRLVTISGMRRRGYRKEALIDFCERIGVSKANNRVDTALLEHCVREDLKPIAKGLMVVKDPIKVTITNYEEGKSELLNIENNQENEDLGVRQVTFSRNIFIERDDFMEDAPSKFFRLTVGKEVRLKGAYFIKCNEVIKDAEGNILELLCTYDVETKSGTAFTGRKVKGTIHWVNAEDCAKVKVRLLDYLVLDDEDSETGVVRNENSLIELSECVAESAIKNATLDDRFQFIRDGYYCLDCRLTSDTDLVFNRIVSLKSSYKPS